MPKALIHEKFGGGIMAASDFDMKGTRLEHAEGDRVKVEMPGNHAANNIMKYCEFSISWQACDRPFFSPPGGNRL